MTPFWLFAAEHPAIVVLGLFLGTLVAVDCNNRLPDEPGCVQIVSALQADGGAL